MVARAAGSVHRPGAILHRHCHHSYHRVFENGEGAGMVMTVIIVAGWVASGGMTYGLLVAHYQRKFPTIAAEYRIIDRLVAMSVALTGPVGLLATLAAGQFKRGWML